MRDLSAPPPRLTDGRYRLLRRLGVGASSSVWLADDLATGFPVALKVGRSAAQNTLLADEALRLAFADSATLVRVLDAGVLDPRTRGASPDLPVSAPFVALEWIDGAALDPRALAEKERREVFWVVARDVGEALEDLHGLGSAHGDVKPANVVMVQSRLGRTGKVVDLGLGAEIDESIPRGGTPRYLAPEISSAGKPSHARGRDLWALGITLAEIASGEVAQASDVHGVLRTGSLPKEMAALVGALLEPRPNARPSATWVRHRALMALGTPDAANTRRERNNRLLKRSYLSLRKAEIIEAARAVEVELALSGAPRVWVEETLELVQRVAALRGIPREGRSRLGALEPTQHSRWLVQIVGAAASSWPALPGSDAELADRLFQLSEQGADLRGLRWRELEAARAAAPVSPTPVSIALALGQSVPRPVELEAAEQWVMEGAPLELGLALGRALRRSGELGRARVVLTRFDAPEAWVEVAETARRARDAQGAESWLSRISEAGTSAEVLGRRAGIRARLELDRGDLPSASAALYGQPETAASLEVRALLQIAQGDRGAAQQTVERARALVTDEEDTARIEAVAGNLHHVSGEPELALRAFRRAAEHATRVGAALEEATYLTGIAASAGAVGEFAEALDAARRAELIFEHLNRPLEAGRAALSRASVFAALGATQETEEAAQVALGRARGEGDRQCQAYAHLALADSLPEGDRNALEHALRARTLLGAELSVDDRLRIDARIYTRGGSVDVSTADLAARQPSTAIDARLEWWSARISQALSTQNLSDADTLLVELGGAVAAVGPVGLRGPALARGTELAVLRGNTDVARRFAQGTREAAQELLRRAPPELRARLSAVRWISTAESGFEATIVPEQVTDIENLVRALGRRDQLRPLLEQVLDALLLWTGVERGLLLLRAPGGRLVVRAARNIARSALTGVQLELSHSLAERALALGEPVVAVDASGELPEVHASVHALKLRSVLAVPLLSRGEPLGVVYLDDRIRRGAFGVRELAWVRLVASLASVAIADARDQLLLRRAARRAHRAEAKLAGQLARREAELELAERELARTKSSRETRFAYHGIVGQSGAMRSMLLLVDRVTAAEVPVLILGESGSGKELIARSIHDNGPRGSKPFVSENCGAIPEPLLESTLFGHVRGAFTGAARPRAGLFEVAHGGTLFLDEIAEMSLGMQTKLLRVLQDGEVRPVGSERSRLVDVRVIGATHRDIEAMVAEGTFRQDLYYRLNVITVRLPPLRERPGDIELLVHHFLKKHAAGKSVVVTPSAIKLLASFPWPGNVRQLENEIRRALVLADDEITPLFLSPEVQQPGGVPRQEDRFNVRARVDALECRLVQEALGETEGNQTRAAQLLGLSRFGLQKMIKRLNIDPTLPRKRSSRLPPTPG